MRPFSAVLTILRASYCSISNFYLLVLVIPSSSVRRKTMEWLTADRILREQELGVFKFSRLRSLVLKCNVRSRVFVSVQNCGY